MWRSINKSVPRAFTDRRNVSTYAGDLLSGAMLFNKRFTAAWAQDNYRDYLSPDPRVLETGKTVLNRVAKQLQGNSSTNSFYRSSSSISNTLMNDNNNIDNNNDIDNSNNYGYDNNTDNNNNIPTSSTTTNTNNNQNNGVYFGYGGY